MRIVRLISLTALLVLAAASHTRGLQARPDFSGVWAFAEDRSPGHSGPPRANFGAEFEIRQDAGNEAEVTNGQTTVKSRAHGEGGRLVIESVATSPGADDKPMTTVSTRTVRIEGTDLVTELTVTSPTRSTSVSVYRHPPAGPPVTIQPARATIGALGWMVGTWEGRQGAAVLEERWTPAAGGAMLGLSRTVAGDRMVAFEFLRIEERDGGLVYLAQPGGRAPATVFTLTRVGPAEAAFENPTHDFPKVITYRLDGDTLTAVITDAGGLKPQHFVFTKRN